jgi:hypothetical protein
MCQMIFESQYTHHPCREADLGGKGIASYPYYICGVLYGPDGVESRNRGVVQLKAIVKPLEPKISCLIACRVRLNLEHLLQYVAHII